jgi:hypothetical protein
MNDVLAAIERHLSRKLSVKQLDYYQVLGLELYCPDPAKIKVALQAAANALASSKPELHPESSVIVGKLLKQAHAVLLDPAKKSAYDKQLAKLLASKAAPASPAPAGASTATAASTQVASPAPVAAPTLSHAAPAATSKVAEQPSDYKVTRASEVAPAATEAAWFPSGDPMAPYSWATAEPLAAKALEPAPALAAVLEIEPRRAELLELFPSLAMLERAALAREAARADSWVDADAYAEDSIVTKLSSRSNAPRSESDKSKSIAKQLKRQRIRRQRWTVGGMIVGAVVLLAAAGVVFLNNRLKYAAKEKERQAKIANPANADPAAASEGAPRSEPGDATRKPRRSEEPVRSNLPSVNRSEPAEPSMASTGATMPMPTNDPATMPAEPTRSESSAPAGNPAPNAPPETAGTPPASPDMAAANPDPPAATRESKSWVAWMKHAREDIEAKKFDAFEKSISQAIESAETADGKEQAARLDQLGQLYRIYVEGFEEAKRKARGATSIKVGNAEYSIVETTSQIVILRAKGKNQTHEWSKLNFGLAVAFSDLGLSTTEPTDLAARAVFFSLDPFYREAAQSNDLVQKRIDGWFEKSLGKGSVRADLKQALTDKYE